MEYKVELGPDQEGRIGTKGKATYTAPKFRMYGSISKLTLGHNGSCTDGNGSRTQTGGGNDGKKCA